VLFFVDLESHSFLYYDSLYGGGAARVLYTARRWLRDEVAARLGEDVAESWKIAEWGGVVDVGLPRQTDFGSCGVFVMAAADCFALRAPVSFTQLDVPVLRQRIGVALLADSEKTPDGCAYLPVLDQGNDASEDE